MNASIEKTTFQNFPALRIETPSSVCTVSLFGAHVLSFVPRGHDDLLWMSPTTKPMPSPIRGGVPLCWPHFAKQGQPDTAPQHGIARSAMWKVTQQATHGSGAVSITFEPEVALHPALRVSSTLYIGAMLRQSMTTTNVSNDSFPLTQAFHTYFRVGDARKIYVNGLSGTRYLSKFDEFKEFAQLGDFKLEHQTQMRSDRIYQRTDGHYSLIDPVLQRRISIASERSSTLVVWNPGAEAVKNFTDIPHDAWPQYFCLEVANAGAEVVTLLRDASVTMAQTISVAALAKNE
jgi:glucose-6-phosphate 1-epimerase